MVGNSAEHEQVSLDLLEIEEVIRDFKASGFRIGIGLEQIEEIAHQVDQVWQVEDDIVCHGRVTYTRHDASELTVPFANVFQLDSGRIRDYLIFVDNSRLFE